MHNYADSLIPLYLHKCALPQLKSLCVSPVTIGSATFQSFLTRVCGTLQELVLRFGIRGVECLGAYLYLHLDWITERIN